METRDTQARSYALDFLKFFAAIGILLHHYQQIFNIKFTHHINFYGDFFDWGALVELFFILSGYFIYKYIRLVGRDISLSQWFVLRTKRLLPLVAVSAVGYELIAYLYFRLCGTYWWNVKFSVWGTFLTALGLQQSWGFSNPMINNPTWYISVLLLCYMFFFVATALARRLKFSPFYIYFLLILIGCGAHIYGNLSPFFDSQAGRGFYSFFFGLLLAHFVKTYGVPKRVQLCCVLMFAYLTFMFERHPNVVKNDLRYLLTFLMYPSIILLFESNPIRSLFRHRIWSVLSAISFNIYVWHLPLMALCSVIELALKCTLITPQVWVMYVFAAITIAFATLSHYLIEKPLNIFVNRQIEFFKARKNSI